MNQIGVYIENSRGWQSEIEYALKFLLNAAGVRYLQVDNLQALSAFERVLIYSEVEKEVYASLQNTVVLFIPSLIHQDDLSAKSTCYREKPVDVYGPFIAYDSVPGYPYSYLEGGCPVRIKVGEEGAYIKLGWDLIGATFHLLNLTRERNQSTRDPEPIAPPRPDYSLQEPTVDRYVLHLEELLDLYDPGLDRVKRWPGATRFAVALTHDVDMLQKWRFRTRLKWTARLPLEAWRNRPQLRSDWQEMRAERDPWDNCEELLRLEKEYDFTSSWFFLTEARDHQTWRYKINGKRARAAVRAIRQEGGEIALHGGYRQAHTLSSFLDQKQQLERVLGRELQGVRQHWLKYSLSKSADAQEKAGFAYDSSLGWNHTAGYRCGTSLPYRLYDPLAKQETGLYEIPLIFMDTASFLQGGLTEQEVSRLLRDLLDRTEKVGGLLTVLFHNHYFYEREFPGWRETYSRFLAEVNERPAWVDTLRNIYRRWRHRSMLLEEKSE